MSARTSVSNRKQPPIPAEAKMTSPNGVHYSVELVTPEMAEQWLAKNSDNRRIRRPVVDRYARDMAAENWPENGAGISFAKSGKLLDGQHRLHAICESETSIWSLVVRNLPEQSQDTMDDGAKRTMADRLNFHGEQNASTAASILRRILMWKQGYKANTGAWTPTVAEALDLLDSDLSTRVAIEAAVAYRTGRLIPPTIIGLTYWLFWNIDPDDAAEFWDGLHRGAGLEEDDARWVVREQMVKVNARPGHVSDAQTVAWVIKAWNFWRKGKPVSVIRMGASEKFPEPR